ncbi:head GIN domain-containing protein [Dyadobacter tibetensis]|uniref:head GIN domain-containing protein n=1 Tax=Dyadobacter tibetensis TaxID=1211851 RepID=UPI0004B72BE1|nr:head GIN domain-containing protein [Dyadobacter tibetensis]
MKNYNLSAALLLFFTFCFQSCIYIDPDGVGPRGPINTQIWNVNNFNQVSASDALKIYIRQGPTRNVEARGKQKDLDDLNIRVENDKLLVDYKKNWFDLRETVSVFITIPEIVSVDFTGAVKGDIQGFDHLYGLDIRLSGASVAAFSGRTKNLSFDLNGASRLEMQGIGDRLEGQLSGASELDSKNYPVDEAILELSGASTAKVWVYDRLKVRASGASTVKYKGSPQVTQDLSGGSQVKKD